MRSGQALVIVLLILAVASALGLSAVSRSVNEINLSTTQDDSSQALSIAESGIEAVIKGNLDGSPLAANSTGTVGIGTYTVASATTFGNASSYVLTTSLDSGESVPLFLRQPDSAGNFTNSSGAFVSATAYGGSSFIVCWGKNSAPDPQPALEVDLYYKANGAPNFQYSLQQSTFDGVASRVSVNKFTSSTGGASCSGYDNQSSISIPASSAPVLAIIRYLYNTGTSHPIQVVAVGGGNTFPPQGSAFEVQGQAGQVSRRVKVSETYPSPFEIINNALFSGTGI